MRAAHDGRLTQGRFEAEDVAVSADPFGDIAQGLALSVVSRPHEPVAGRGDEWREGEHCVGEFKSKISVSKNSSPLSITPQWMIRREVGQELFLESAGP